MLKFYENNKIVIPKIQRHLTQAVLSDNDYRNILHYSNKSVQRRSLYKHFMDFFPQNKGSTAFYKKKKKKKKKKNPRSF